MLGAWASSAEDAGGLVYLWKVPSADRLVGGNIHISTLHPRSLVPKTLIVSQS